MVGIVSHNWNFLDPAPLFFTNVLTNPLFSQRGYQAYKAKYPWGRKRFALGFDLPVFFATVAICHVCLCFKLPPFLNRSQPIVSKLPPFVAKNQKNVNVHVLGQRNSQKDLNVSSQGGPRHYDPGVYNQQREQLMAILPKSQQELPPRRWNILYKFNGSWKCWRKCLNSSGCSTVMTPPSSPLAAMLCSETGLHFTFISNKSSLRHPLNVFFYTQSFATTMS